MRALQIHAARDLRVADIAPQPLAADEVRVAVKSGGICGSDLAYYFKGRVGDFALREPMILGHEVAGDVVEIGSDVNDLSIGEAVAAVRATIGHMVKVEVEVDRLDQIEPALEAGADVILLDNMEPKTLARAVELVHGAAITEASGGITKDTIAEVAATGVDVISLGALTHSAPRLDVALDLA